MKDWLRISFRNFFVACKSTSWRWALLVAAISDIAGLWVMIVPPAQWMLDITTAAFLLLILGFRWPILSVLVIEAVPFLQAFPAWVLVVIALAASNNGRSKEVQPR